MGSLAVDRSALALLYDRYSSRVYGLALKALGNQDEAQDLTQEIFLTLRQQAKSYDAGRGSLAGFLVTLTRSRAIDRLRARGRKVRLLRAWHRAAPLPADIPTPVERLSLAECSARVRGALAELPANERRVLEMAYFQGLTQVEIAADLGAPLGTVKSWSRRGLLALQHALADLVE